jgi:hypothetical protein
VVVGNTSIYADDVIALGMFRVLIPSPQISENSEIPHVKLRCDAAITIRSIKGGRSEMCRSAYFVEAKNGTVFES